MHRKGRDRGRGRRSFYRNNGEYEIEGKEVLVDRRDVKGRFIKDYTKTIFRLFQTEYFFNGGKENWKRIQVEKEKEIERISIGVEDETMKVLKEMKKKMIGMKNLNAIKIYYPFENRARRRPEPRPQFGLGGNIYGDLGRRMRLENLLNQAQNPNIGGEIDGILLELLRGRGGRRERGGPIVQGVQQNNNVAEDDDSDEEKDDGEEKKWVIELKNIRRLDIIYNAGYQGFGRRINHDDDEKKKFKSKFLISRYVKYLLIDSFHFNALSHYIKILSLRELKVLEIIEVDFKFNNICKLFEIVKLERIFIKDPIFNGTVSVCNMKDIVVSHSLKTVEYIQGESFHGREDDVNRDRHEQFLNCLTSVHNLRRLKFKGSNVLTFGGAVPTDDVFEMNFKTFSRMKSLYFNGNMTTDLKYMPNLEYLTLREMKMDIIKTDTFFDSMNILETKLKILKLVRCKITLKFHRIFAIKNIHRVVFKRVSLIRNYTEDQYVGEIIVSDSLREFKIYDSVGVQKILGPFLDKFDGLKSLEVVAKKLDDRFFKGIISSITKYKLLNTDVSFQDEMKAGNLYNEITKVKNVQSEYRILKEFEKVKFIPLHPIDFIKEFVFNPALVNILNDPKYFIERNIFPIKDEKELQFNKFYSILSPKLIMKVLDYFFIDYELLFPKVDPSTIKKKSKKVVKPGYGSILRKKKEKVKIFFDKKIKILFGRFEGDPNPKYYQIFRNFYVKNYHKSISLKRCVDFDVRYCERKGLFLYCIPEIRNNVKHRKGGYSIEASFLFESRSIQQFLFWENLCHVEKIAFGGNKNVFSSSKDELGALEKFYNVKLLKISDVDDKSLKSFTEKFPDKFPFLKFFGAKKNTIYFCDIGNYEKLRTEMRFFVIKKDFNEFAVQRQKVLDRPYYAVKELVEFNAIAKMKDEKGIVRKVEEVYYSYFHPNIIFGILDYLSFRFKVINKRFLEKLKLTYFYGKISHTENGRRNQYIFLFLRHIEYNFNHTSDRKFIKFFPKKLQIVNTRFVRIKQVVTGKKNKNTIFEKMKCCLTTVSINFDVPKGLIQVIMKGLSGIKSMRYLSFRKPYNTVSRQSEQSYFSDYFFKMVCTYSYQWKFLKFCSIKKNEFIVIDASNLLKYDQYNFYLFSDLYYTYCSRDKMAIIDYTPDISKIKNNAKLKASQKIEEFNLLAAKHPTKFYIFDLNNLPYGLLPFGCVEVILDYILFYPTGHKKYRKNNRVRYFFGKYLDKRIKVINSLEFNKEYGVDDFKFLPKNMIYVHVQKNDDVLIMSLKKDKEMKVLSIKSYNPKSRVPKIIGDDDCRIERISIENFDFEGKKNVFSKIFFRKFCKQKVGCVVLKNCKFAKDFQTDKGKDLQNDKEKDLIRLFNLDFFAVDKSSLILANLENYRRLRSKHQFFCFNVMARIKKIKEKDKKIKKIIVQDKSKEDEIFSDYAKKRKHPSKSQRRKKNRKMRVKKFKKEKREVRKLMEKNPRYFCHEAHKSGKTRNIPLIIRDDDPSSKTKSYTSEFFLTKMKKEVESASETSENERSKEELI